MSKINLKKDYPHLTDKELTDQILKLRRLLSGVYKHMDGGLQDIRLLDLEQRVYLHEAVSTVLRYVEGVFFED